MTKTPPHFEKYPKIFHYLNGNPVLSYPKLYEAHFLSSTFKVGSLWTLHHSTLRSSPIPSKESLRFGTMALRLSLSPPPIRSSASPSWAAPHSIAISCSSSSSVGVSVPTQEKRRARVVVRSSSIDTAEAVVGQVTEVNKDTFWPIVKAAGDKAVVLDMYTQWYVCVMNPFLLWKCGVEVWIEVVLEVIFFWFGVFCWLGFRKFWELFSSFSTFKNRKCFFSILFYFIFKFRSVHILEVFFLIFLFCFGFGKLAFSVI